MLTITGADLIVVDGSTERTGDLVIDDDGRVARDPTAATGSDEQVLSGSGAIVTPGLINAHHHLLQSAFRTLPGTRGVPMAEWLSTMRAAYEAAGVDPELAGAAAGVGWAEALLCGVTTVADHHLTWPPGCDPVAIATATAATAARLGARLVFVHGSAGNRAEDIAAAATAVVERLVPCREDGVSADGMVQVAVGPAGVHSDGQETFEALARLGAPPWPAGSACAGAPRRTSRWTSRWPDGATVAARSTCSAIGAGWSRTSPSRTCATSRRPRSSGSARPG